MGRLFAKSAALALGLAALCSDTAQAIQNRATPTTQFSDNGFTDVVQWDKYSLVIKGQRVFIHSGEFHTFRLPVPDLWPDILQKFKAAGLNAVSIYLHWGLLNPSRGVVDFDSNRALQPFLDAAKDAGLWVILRPGPYINAETTAGGMPHWVTAEVPGFLRTNSSSYTEAYTPYWNAIADITVKNSITNGGSIILIQVDNEYVQMESYGNPGKAGYFHDLQQILRKRGVTIPTTYNDPGQGRSFVEGYGKVDLYGLDHYPNGFDCSNPDKWNPVDTSYYQYHMSTNPDQPWYIPEFQSGSVDPWGPATGYEGCRQLTGPEFESVFNKNLWANNFKLISFYMAYGGTSWGHLPFPKVYTSYDYGAAITEPRQLTPKYTELKLQGLFLRSAPEFKVTDVMGYNTAGGAVSTSGGPVYVTWLKNPETGAGFYVSRHADSTSKANVTFGLTVPTSAGTQVLGGISLLGRQSKVILTDFAYGSSRALYLTAGVLFAGKLGTKDVLFVYGDIGTTNQLAIKVSGGKAALQKSGDSDAVTFDSASGYITLTYKPTKKGLTAIWESDKQLIIASDPETAGTFYSPVLAGSSKAYPAYWEIGTNSTVLIGGPYLVRDAKVKGTTLQITGDLDKDTKLTIIGAPKAVKTVTFNGRAVSLTSSGSGLASVDGILLGSISLAKIATASAITLPNLASGWKYTDSLPEIGTKYSDSKWITANHTTTISPYKPYYGDKNGPTLYGCEYGYCEGHVLFRGHFKASGQETAVNLTINGGEAFAASVWINGKFIKSTYGRSTYPAYGGPDELFAIEETDETYTFPAGSLVPGGDNVITVLQDNMGLNETYNGNAEPSKSPRGIRGYKLVGADTTFSSWKVQGKLGGYNQFPDKVRGVLNEGGLFAERAGYHLPSLPSAVSSAWSSRSPSQGLPSGSAGVGFFTKEFSLNIPKGVDAVLSFTFKSGTGASDHWRGTLWINGWTMGRVVGNLGPQFKFPVHEGILNYRGKNTISLALWSMEDAPISVSVTMDVDAVYDGGVGDVDLVGSGEKWVARIGA